VYAAGIVEERLEHSRQVLGFPLEYHSVAEVEDFDLQLQRKYADDYQAAELASSGSQFPAREFQVYLTRALCDPSDPRLSSDEIRWMLNERHLAMCDAAYYGTRYYWLKNIHNDLQRFTFRPAQRIYFDVIAELESRGLSVELLCAKARQLGVSTETELFISQRVFFNYGVSSTIASFDQSKTAEMANMLFLAYDMLPWWMRPTHTRRVESDRGMLIFGGQRSGVKFQHGTQASGISQGTTPTVYHLSECSYYPDPEKLIEIGLFKAVHSSPKVFGVLESTACGDTGWWPDKYWYYKRKWPNCRMLALFLPWFLGTDLYPNETWLRKSPVPRNWAPRDETVEMTARAGLYVKSNQVLEKVLGTGWGLPREQAWWWEVQYNEALDGGKVKTFLQEYPTDDQESFQGSYESVFGRETIATVYSRRETKYKVFGIVGQSIETKNEPYPDDVDYSSPRIPVAYSSNRGDTYRWELVPLKWRESWDKLSDIREVEIPNGLLMVFGEPEPGYDYSLGIDTSTGIGDEATVLAMARRAKTGEDPDIQVAEFRSNLVSHVEAYPYAVCLAAYYAKYMPSTTRYREPYVSIEQVQAVGDTVYKDMWRMGYSRFHRMIRYDNKPSATRRSRAIKTGWFTNTWSRPILCDNFVVGVRNGWYVVNSPWTIWEMQHWETRLTGTGREKKTHSSDSTDDGIFANAMAWFCPNDLRSLTERTKKKCQGPDADGVLPPLDVGAWGGLQVATKTSREWRSTLDPLREGLEDFR
jgi:hypothetical protein